MLAGLRASIASNGVGFGGFRGRAILVGFYCLAGLLGIGTDIGEHTEELLEMWISRI